jgi:hypothetical protein
MAAIFKHLKAVLLTISVFIIFAVIFFKALPDYNDTVPLVASVVATALAVFLYTKIPKKVGL